MKSIALLVATSLLFVWWAPAQALGQVQPTMTWEEFLARYERDVRFFRPFSIDTAIDTGHEPDIVMVTFQTPLSQADGPATVRKTAYAWYAIKDYHAGALPMFIIIFWSEKNSANQWLGMRLQFWKKAVGTQFARLEEALLQKTDDRSEKQIWSDTSPPMVEFHQWLSSLGAKPTVRFRFLYAWRGDIFSFIYRFLR